MLLAIKDYLSVRKTASLQELSLHFCKHPEMMRDMMSHWVRKGKVCCLQKPPGCGTRCVQCKPEFAEEYQWVEPQE